MKTVWVVEVSYPALSLVDDELHIIENDLVEIRGIFSTEEKARELQEQLVGENAQCVVALGCDPIEVWIAEREVQ